MQGKARPRIPAPISDRGRAQRSLAPLLAALPSFLPADFFLGGILYSDTDACSRYGQALLAALVPGILSRPGFRSENACIRLQTGWVLHHRKLLHRTLYYGKRPLGCAAAGLSMQSQRTGPTTAAGAQQCMLHSLSLLSGIANHHAPIGWGCSCWRRYGGTPCACTRQGVTGTG